MQTRVETSKQFNREFKRLSKKYRDLLEIVVPFSARLGSGERLGERLAGIGYEAYKVRLENPAAKRGRSGGFRIIYYVESPAQVILITMFSKTEHANISNSEIQQIIAAEIG